VLACPAERSRATPALGGARKPASSLLSSWCVCCALRALAAAACSTCLLLFNTHASMHIAHWVFDDVNYVLVFGWHRFKAFAWLGEVLEIAKQTSSPFFNSPRRHDI
jgi:hypothetical protein